jgi:DNA repair exonuclease SbcCD ATPase subunit
MIISELSLFNWECFHGLQRLQLKSGMYAITATYASDPDLSNAGGKTSILAAIDFALSGHHRHRYADEWISKGATSGYVEVTLMNPGRKLVIKRSRTVEKSELLEVNDNDSILKGAEAELRIREFIGLTPEDFYASAYLRQKDHSRFVVGDPSERRAILNAWFDLEKLVAAEKYAKDKADALEAHALSREAYVRGGESAAYVLVSKDSKDIFADLQVQRTQLE